MAPFESKTQPKHGVSATLTMRQFLQFGGLVHAIWGGLMFTLVAITLDFLAVGSETEAADEMTEILHARFQRRQASRTRQPEAGVPIPGSIVVPNHVCAAGPSGRMNCWGEDTDGRVSKPHSARAIIQISASDRHTCGVHANNSISCWGNPDVHLVSGPNNDLSKDFFKVSTGYYETCGHRRNGTTTCWGWDGKVHTRTYAREGPVST